MRISDWRSDVCSSDLASSNPLTRRLDRASRCYRGQKCKRAERTHLGGRRDNRGHPSWWFFRLELRETLVEAVLFLIVVRQFSRSEERRVGARGGSKCRVRWSAVLEQKNNNIRKHN